MKITRNIRLCGSTSVADALAQLPPGIDTTQVYIDYEKEWSWGDETTYVQFSWVEEESPTERAARRATEKRLAEEKKQEQEERDQTEYARLCRKYGTYV